LFAVKEKFLEGMKLPGMLMVTLQCAVNWILRQLMPLVIIIMSSSSYSLSPWSIWHFIALPNFSPELQSNASDGFGYK
jgi:hypothetical protein